MRCRFVVVVALAAFAAACTIVNGLSVSTMSTGGTDADADGGADVFADPYPCNHVLPPAPPDPGVPDPGGITFVSALSFVDLGIHVDGGFDSIGFDLDNRCTCDLSDGGLTPPTCNSPQGVDSGVCDLDGGVDNAATILFQSAVKLSNGDIDLEADLNNDLKNGNHGVLVWVQNYNGKPEDNDVTISVTISPGTEAGGKPKFEQGETWSLSQSDTVSAGAGGFVPGTKLSGLHYVTGGILVGKGQIAIPLLANLTVTLSDGYLVGRIEKGPMGFYVASGTVTGRAQLDQVIRSIGGVSKPAGSDQHLCDDPNNALAFSILKSNVCDARDIMASPSDDNKGLTCDGLSLGVNFQAVNATTGTQRPLQSVTYCQDADVTCPL